LKQAPRAWYARIDSYLMSLGFTKSDVDPNLYSRLRVVVRVDIMVVAGAINLHL
jgi:hypothetical protein